MFHPIYSFKHYAHFNCAWAGSAQKITLAAAANDTNARMALRVVWGALGTIERPEPALDALFAKDAVIEEARPGTWLARRAVVDAEITAKVFIEIRKRRNKPSSCSMVNCRSW